MKEKIKESVEITRQYFNNKKCTAFEFFNHLQRELRVRHLDDTANILQELLLEQVKKGGF